MELDYDSLYVGGEWITPRVEFEDHGRLGEHGAGHRHVPEAVEADIDAAVGAARRAFDDPNGWAHWEPSQRAAAMERLASALDKRAGEMVRRISSQNGMPVAVASQLEAVFPALLLRYYAGLVSDDTFEENRPGLLGGTTLVRREPLGVVRRHRAVELPADLGVLQARPAPGLAAGGAETVVGNRARQLPARRGDGRGGAARGVVNIVPGGRGMGAYLVSHPQVDKIAFTGSTQAGRSIAETCGRAASTGHPGAGGQVGGDRAG